MSLVMQMQHPSQVSNQVRLVQHPSPRPKPSLKQALDAMDVVSAGQSEGILSNLQLRIVKHQKSNIRSQTSEIKHKEASGKS
jgi:hypothetical protein